MLNKILCLVVFFLVSNFNLSLTAQTIKYCPNIQTGSPTPDTMNIVIDENLRQHIRTSSSTIKNIKAFIQVDFGEQYPFGEEAFNKNLNLGLSTISKPTNTTTTFSTSSNIINLIDDKPEQIVHLNLATPTNLELDTIIDNGGVIYQIIIDPSWVASILNPDFIDPSNYLRIQLCYEIEYSVTVDQHQLAKLPPTQLGMSKRYNLAWVSPNILFPNYEIQVLKLYNTEQDNPTSQEDVKTTIDWSKALSVTVPYYKVAQSNGTTFRYDLTLSEGTGYYTWRVRPIGSFYEGGQAHSDNWGVWDKGSANHGDQVDFDHSYNTYTTGYASHYFYFIDQDEQKDINYIYNRVFTEEGKTHEGISYADRLLKTRQTQSYLPSNPTHKNVVSQSLSDHVGRAALNTLPVPTNSDLGYQEKFIQNAGGNLYVVENFDNDTKLENPDTIKQVGTAFSYYSDGNVHNKYVPDAEGYAFSRSLYAKDGLGYVEKQSGVGKTHMVGSTADGRGRVTTKSYASDATKAELIRIFGDNAPHLSSITKEITIDPNGTKSIAYSSKTGQVIATCLAYNSDENLLDSLDSEGTPLSIKDLMQLGTHTSEGFVSSKRLVFTDSTTLAINYIPKTCGGVLICGQSIDCNYEVSFYVSNIDSPTVYLLDTTRTTLALCQTSGIGFDLNLPAGDYIVKKVIEPIDNGVSDAIANNVSEIEAALNAYALLIAALLANVSEEEDWWDFEDCVACVESFVTDTLPSSSLQSCFDGLINNSVAIIDTNIIDIAIFDTIAREKVTSITIDTSGIQIAYDDCSSDSSSLSVDASFEPSSPCSSGDCFDGQYRYKSKYDTFYTCYDFPPFLEYFVDINWDDLKASGLPIQTTLDTLFPDYGIDSADIADWVDGIMTYAAFNDNDFNRMVWHMLNDQYYCGQVAWDNTSSNYKNIRSDGTLDTVEFDLDTFATVQYDCRQVWKCWKGNVLMIKQVLDYYNDTLAPTSLDPLAVFDGQQNGDSSVLDNHINNHSNPTIDSFLTLSDINPLDRIRLDPSDPRSVIDEIDGEQLKFNNIVVLFLECTGYRYARIIDPRNLIGSLTDTSTIVGICSSYLNSQPIHTGATKPTTAFNTLDIPLIGLGYQSSLLGYSNEIVEYFATRKDSTVKDLPFTYNPVFAFKYYEYLNVQPIDTSRVMAISIATGFPYSDLLAVFTADPSDEYIACEQQHNYSYNKDTLDEYCVPEVTISGHDIWTCGKRDEFYRCLQYATGVIVPTDTAIMDSLGCDSIRLAWADSTLVNGYSKNPIERDCQIVCENRREEFRKAITDALLRRCYTVDACPSCNNAVSAEDIETLTQVLIDNCQGQCVATVGDSAEIKNCLWANGVRLSICDFLNGTPCEKYLIKQVHSWNPKVDFPSVCSGDATAYPDGHLYNDMSTDPDECVGTAANVQEKSKVKLKTVTLGGQ